MDYNKLIAALEEHFNRVRDFAYNGNETLVTEEIGEMKEIEHYGGEGQGEDWWTVYFFPKHDIHIKVSGWYSSGNGVEFEGGWESDCSEVKPIQKTITVYE